MLTCLCLCLCVRSSTSWRFSNKGNKSSLDTDDIKGAQPGEPNKFLQVHKRIQSYTHTYNPRTNFCTGAHPPYLLTTANAADCYNAYCY